MARRLAAYIAMLKMLTAINKVTKLFTIYQPERRACFQPSPPFWKKFKIFQISVFQTYLFFNKSNIIQNGVEAAGPSPNKRIHARRRRSAEAPRVQPAVRLSTFLLMQKVQKCFKCL